MVFVYKFCVSGPRVDMVMISDDNNQIKYDMVNAMKINIVAISVLLTLMSTTSQASFFAYDRAVAAAQQGDIDTAQQVLHKLLIDDPENPSVLYDAGVIAAQKQEFEQAAAYFDRAACSPKSSGALKERAHFNHGNALVALKKLDDASAQYEATLAINPANEYARHNLEVVKKMREQQKQEKQEQSSGDKSQPQDQQQNQEQGEQGQEGKNNDNSGDRQQQKQENRDEKKQHDEQNSDRQNKSSCDQNTEQSSHHESQDTQQSNKKNNPSQSHERDAQHGDQRDRGSDEHHDTSQKPSPQDEEHKKSRALNQAQSEQKQEQVSAAKAAEQKNEKEKNQRSSYQQSQNGKDQQDWLEAVLAQTEEDDVQGNKQMMRMLAGKSKLHDGDQHGW